MRVVVQRVRQASVWIRGVCHSQIEAGFLVLLGIESDDNPDDADWLTQKLASLRIFSDSEGKMNLDIKESKGASLVVSQFTLHASTRKGNRPSFIRAARPDVAIPLYNYFIAQLELATKQPVYTGAFGADMQVSLINDGPVTILIDSKNRE